MAGARQAWIFPADHGWLPQVDAAVSADYLHDEAAIVRSLRAGLRIPSATRRRIRRRAIRLVESMRSSRAASSGIDALMAEYDLSSNEGIALMCLAEALLRIPDARTADRLIEEKIGASDWSSHFDAGAPLFVNASTWALMLTGRMLRPAKAHGQWTTELVHAVNRLGDPVIRTALRQAMRVLGHQFVLGRTIAEALDRAESSPSYRYSFDMLGEAALTYVDADRYFDAYRSAIYAIGEQSPPSRSPVEAPSISIKLSALSPRFEFSQQRTVIPVLTERLATLASAAHDAGVAVTIDAEEADRLELTLAIFAGALEKQRLRDWGGLGLAVQAYQKRARAVIHWLEECALAHRIEIPVRLVKGAYWDTEIKFAQARGFVDYPVFTRKANTDLSYLACAERLLMRRSRLYPQFATHNAHTVAWILERSQDRAFEFQRLHGMGETLYDGLAGNGEGQQPCRVYAPVGAHEDLLPYLVRRLLENGANTSFVNRFVHADLAADDVIEDPWELTKLSRNTPRHPRIPVPPALFGAERLNSGGINLCDRVGLREFAAGLGAADTRDWRATPIVDGAALDGEARQHFNPADSDTYIGETVLADEGVARRALARAAAAQEAWDSVGGTHRAGVLRSAADALEQHRAELVARCVREGGRTVPDSLDELREAVDFLRYYAVEAERLFARPRELAGVTGERNVMSLHGRGVFLCISPWNFPLSIFVGQIAGALAAGNTVLAKPAEQGSLVAHCAVELLLASGVPTGALQFLPGDGATIANAVLADARLAGVAFTGSTETAAAIYSRLGERRGPIATMVAETGGINAMIADSSALPEQVVRDVIRSAFNSAGQRCSALRLLCLQQDTADRVLEMLEGAMNALVIGDPGAIETDVGPVIDAAARTALESYVATRKDRVRTRCTLASQHEIGHFVAPTLIELAAVRDLEREIFGPILHVVRYSADRIEALVDEINALGYGLTLGIHSRVESLAKKIAGHAAVGNIYVNRDMIGAQVGVQPFGGMGLSGTGPKAGGPHYLAHFAVEKVVTTNTAAVGGNASLLAAESDPA